MNDCEKTQAVQADPEIGYVEHFKLGQYISITLPSVDIWNHWERTKAAMDVLLNHTRKAISSNEKPSERQPRIKEDG